MNDKQKVTRVEVYWHTVKYRTVVLYGLLIAVIVLLGVYVVFPSVSGVVMQKLSQAFAEPTTPAASADARQARFVNLDGMVQVKKANSVQWMTADLGVTLDKGDLIRTGPEGVARIAFADGTQYTVKGDTLVTVEENNVGQDSSQVAVHITSGQVDLNTGGLSSGSKAEVSVANAVADVHSNSHAAVSSDPTTQEQQITVTSGSAELTRGSEHMDIGQSERATFVTGQAGINKTQVLAAPELVEPLNLAPKFVADPKTDPVHFSWKPVPTAKMYEFQASTTTAFKQLVKDVKTSETGVDVTGFEAGPYFWRVIAIDDKNEMSDASDAFKFTLAVQGKNHEMFLAIDRTQLEGNSVEIVGRTEPGAILIINGMQVADMDGSGNFRYFSQPQTSGSHRFMITGQNRRGDTTMKPVDIVIP